MRVQNAAGSSHEPTVPPDPIMPAIRSSSCKPIPPIMPMLGCSSRLRIACDEREATKIDIRIYSIVERPRTGEKSMVHNASGVL